MVRGITRKDFSFWQNLEEETAVLAKLRKGSLHFAGAVRTARKALASGDSAEILEAALLCPGFERTGRELLHRDRAAAQRRSGGKKRGEQLTEQAAEVWAPYVEQFQRLLAAGKTPARARISVTRQMDEDGFLLPSTGKPPDPRTVRDHLRAK
jgi:hypothetical protein